MFEDATDYRVNSRRIFLEQKLLNGDRLELKNSHFPILHFAFDGMDEIGTLFQRTYVGWAI